MRAIPYAETVQEAERLKAKFQLWCKKKGLEHAGLHNQLSGHWVDVDREDSQADVSSTTR